ncbi:hypothetical protein A2454_05715 [Candidatus Peribacteria bacterium RIFOXYC2_FULL_55_14]|nr:MAG: Addiction module toxin, RelE/StbE family [Candidatus Peribacteria bacterium GW2011_GWB1_54_5]KKW38574.1 MAG: Addiction module toxin, RelE/StbE family [Candidatus Peribacteria bacterium GW2011_GWC2_54_8]KKW43341.1 MAG: Addiction module toxin, RelE/StbE family [Candidatus Peregrinibacteria bacterium GW2011_GWA2_54_9]OGJ72059.1 MAG: hypothetical protein A2198_04270 [Candidatus Peribacteria bacterium RIFOXYA1_FULL_56_14]OGJ74072.1 MAG: hypothetical protein A2217_00290 [Candidatus Peribacter
MYTIELTKKAEKSLESLRKRDQQRVMAGIESLREDPFIGKKLQGPLEGLRSLRVWPFRIIYSVNKKVVMVTVVAIGNRKDVYKKS